MISFVEKSIHVYKIHLDHIFDDDIKPFMALLNADEQARCLRFKFEKDQQRYAIARATLRKLLGNYLKTDPQNLSFTYNKHTKPSLADEINHLKLHFNVSHAENCILIAITQLAPIGVDVESLARKLNYLEMAKSTFTQEEYQAIAKLADTQLGYGFFYTWTCKEAFVKAIGKGIAFGMDKFAINADLSPSPPLLYINDDDAPAATNWTLFSFKPFANYIAALAIAKPCSDLDLHIQEVFNLEG